VRRTRILVADSVPIFRSAVRTLLAREGDFDVAEAEDFAALERHVATECPDIALVDLHLEPRGGILAVEALAGRCGTHTIVWSLEPTPAMVLAAIKAGASGYLHKEISPRGLVRSLQGVTDGEAPLSRDLAALLIDALHGAEEREHARDLASTLSIREREVLTLIARGARNRQIANHLDISEFTVKRHVQNILHKLDVPSRQAAAAFHRSAYGALEAPPITAASAG
jgi:DNA-binding NarL/FixJ family response regulator